MCYYDVYHFACRDWEWGGLVSHCAALGKSGEYCLGNLAANIITNSQDCPHCQHLTLQRRKIDALEQESWNFAFVGGQSVKQERKINAAKTELRELESQVNAMRFRKEGSRFAMMGSMQSLAHVHATKSKDASPFATAPQVVQSLSLPPALHVVSPSSPTSTSSTKTPDSVLSRSSTSTGSSRDLKLVSTWEEDEPQQRPRTKSVGWLRKRLRDYADDLKRDMSFED